MPRAIFKLLWDTIGSRQEIFAFVNNLASNGDHYWVLAHVTPSVGPSGAVVGYHSNRRVPDRDAVETVAALYDELLREERRHADRQRGLQASMVMLRDVLAQRRLRYDEFVFSLISHEVAA